MFLLHFRMSVFARVNNSQRVISNSQLAHDKSECVAVRPQFTIHSSRFTIRNAKVTTNSSSFTIKVLSSQFALHKSSSWLRIHTSQHTHTHIHTPHAMLQTSFQLAMRFESESNSSKNHDCVYLKLRSHKRKVR